MNPQPGQYLEIEPGIELYYEDRGQGQPLILIPGWTFTTELFQHQVDHFSQSKRVIAFDPRSHGRSTVTVQGNNYATHGADLAKLIDALDLEDVVLLGWSFGCLTVWEYIRQHGTSNVAAAICVDLSPRPLSVNDGDWVEGPLGEIGAAYNAYVQSTAGQRGFVEYYATEVMVQRELTPAELFWIIEQSLNTPYYVASNLFASGMFSDYLAEAQQLEKEIPSLSIIAEHWAETAVAFMNNHCPQTKTAVLGGHMMFWEHPQEFNQIVDEFLA